MVEEPKVQPEPRPEAAGEDHVEIAKLRGFLELMFLVSAGRKSGRVTLGAPGSEHEVLFHRGWVEGIEALHSPGLAANLLTGIRRPLDKKIHAMPDEIKLDCLSCVSHLVETGAATREEMVGVFAGYLKEVLAGFQGMARECLAFLPTETDGSGSEEEGQGPAPPLGLHFPFEPLWGELFCETRAHGAGDSVFPHHDSVVIRTGGKMPSGIPELQQEIFRLANGEHSIGEMVQQFSVDSIVFFFHVLTLRARGLLIEAGPDRLAALAGKARAEGRLDLAVRFFEKAKTCGATDPVIFQELGRIYEVMGRAENAAENFLIFARSCKESGDDARAAEFYEKVLAVDPHSAEALSVVIEAAWQRGDRVAALPRTQNLVEVATQIGDWKLANHARKILIENDAGDEKTFSEFFDGVRRENDRDAAVSQLRFLYSHLLKAGMQDRAREVLGRLLAIDGGLLEERYDLASLLLESGRFDDARRELMSLHQTLFEIDPEEETPRWELLKKVCEVLVRVEPENRDARRWLAYGCRVCLETEAAQEHLDWIVQDHLSRQEFEPLADLIGQLMKRDPDSLELLELGTGIMIRAGKLDAASSYSLKRAEKAMANGDRETATQALQRVVEIQPLHPEANHNLAELAREREPGGEALVGYLRRLAVASTAHGDFSKALEVYRELLQVRPDDSFYHQGYCELLAWTGDRDSLVAALVEAGQCSVRRGDRGTVREVSNRLQAVSPRHPALADFEASLQEVRPSPLTLDSTVGLGSGDVEAPTVPVAESRSTKEEAGSPEAAVSPTSEFGEETSLDGPSSPSPGKPGFVNVSSEKPAMGSSGSPSGLAESSETDDDVASPGAGTGAGFTGDQFSSIVEALKAVQGGGSDSGSGNPSVDGREIEGDAANVEGGQEEDGSDDPGFRKESAEASISGIVANLKALKGQS